MQYTARNFEHLIGMEGFSDTLLKNHFTLYQGYVTNTNKLGDMLTTQLKEGKLGPEYAELRRRFGWEWNGMRLHEFYFDNLGGAGKGGPGSEFNRLVTQTWGSYENWHKEFTTIGTMRGIGWVVLYQDTATGNLFNLWITEHDGGHAAGARPIVVMDVFEHAFLTDYGLKRADYVQAFWNNVNWTAIEQRIAGK
jgi:Fe-Mn family superoxide dismutase